MSPINKYERHQYKTLILLCVAKLTDNKQTKRHESSNEEISWFFLCGKNNNIGLTFAACQKAPTIGTSAHVGVPALWELQTRLANVLWKALLPQVGSWHQKLERQIRGPTTQPEPLWPGPPICPRGSWARSSARTSGLMDLCQLRDRTCYKQVKEFKFPHASYRDITCELLEIQNHLPQLYKIKNLHF